jgi:hypothetical protein
MRHTTSRLRPPSRFPLPRSHARAARPEVIDSIVVRTSVSSLCPYTSTAHAPIGSCSRPATQAVTRSQRHELRPELPGPKAACLHAGGRQAYAPTYPDRHIETFQNGQAPQAFPGGTSDEGR